MKELLAVFCLVMIFFLSTDDKTILSLITNKTIAKRVVRVLVKEFYQQFEAPMESFHQDHHQKSEGS